MVKSVWDSSHRGTSPIDWCEQNYTFSPFIAEFVNTITNIIFLVFPPFLMVLFREYGQFVNQGIHVIWTMMIVVGISSAYFHATLSLLGQLLDELAILWVFFAGVSMFFPTRLLPSCLRHDRRVFSYIVLVVACILTGLAIMKPMINAFALMTLGIPAVIVLAIETYRTDNARVQRLGIRSTVVWGLAVFCWTNDRLLCEAWSQINFPYLHGIWHILIFIAGYNACVLFAYYSVREQNPSTRAVLHYWPNNDFEFGLPYVRIKRARGGHDHEI